VDIDSHHHLWVPDPRRYPWLSAPSLAALNRPFGTADLAAAAAGTGIGATVVVQAAEDVTETEELRAGPAAAGPGLVMAAVVGWLDLADPGAPDRLARLLAGPGGRRLAGLRANLRDTGDPGRLAGPVPAAALRRLAGEGLALDVLAGPPGLAAVTALAAAHPDLRVILDHAGHPPLGAPAAELAAWAASVRRLARHPNVAVKFSGLLTRAAGVRWDAADLRPVAETLLAAFGEDRVMFGSDWPVCLLSASYAEVAAAAREALSGADPGRVFGGNARSWYRLRGQARAGETPGQQGQGQG
jgi:L-fuconolactonase